MKRLFVALFVFQLTACAAAPAPTTPALTATLVAALPTPTPTATIAPTATRTNLPAPADLALTATARVTPDATLRAAQQAAPLIEIARADLAARLSTGAESIAFLQQEMVRWRDTALECSGAAGERRAVEGYRLLLGVGETVYEYHTDTGSTARLCRESNLYDDYPEILLMRDPVAAELVYVAQERLGRELDLPTSLIDLVSIRPVEWADASLGCPAEGQTYSPAPVKGYQIVLEVNETRYTFHTDFESVIECNV